MFHSIKSLFKKNYIKSYSQSGEDMIIKYIFNTMNIQYPSYIDIGANHPFYLNNSAFFYLNGSKGFCIDPDPTICEQLKKYRKKDIIINKAISDKNSYERFYIMSNNVLNTFNENLAKTLQQNKICNINAAIEVEIISIDSLIDKYHIKDINFISIDVEGCELKILNSFNFNRIKPEVFCIETASWDGKNSIKNYDIDDVMSDNGYFKYADTYINSIYVLNSLKNRYL